jgi:hypothetical protein
LRAPDEDGSIEVIGAPTTVDSGNFTVLVMTVW